MWAVVYQGDTVSVWDAGIMAFDTAKWIAGHCARETGRTTWVVSPEAGLIRYVIDPQLGAAPMHAAIGGTVRRALAADAAARKAS